MMQPALNHVEGRMLATSGRKLACGGMGQPAPIIRHDQSQFAPERLPSPIGSGRNRRGGSERLQTVRQTVARGTGVSPLKCTAFRPNFLRVGWCFQTSRDFLEFHALTRAGIRPDHAVALLYQTADHLPARDTDLPPTTHSFDLSSVAVLDDRDRDTPKGQIIGTSVQRAS